MSSNGILKDEYSKVNSGGTSTIFGGYLYDYLDVRLPFTLSAIFFTITTLIFYKTYREGGDVNP